MDRQENEFAEAQIPAASGTALVLCGLGRVRSVRKLYLIDATYELFRSYFAVPSRRAPDGREVGAVAGLCASLVALLNSGEVTYAGCATDRTVESFRNALFDGYKTGEGLDPDLLAQFPLAEDGLRALGLTVWPMVEFEADDALATAAQRYRRGFDQIVIATPDKDLAQCVEGDRVVLWDRRRDLVYDEAGVVEKWGIAPGSMPDYLALVGDAADGLPGVPGWGAKSTSTVLRHYGTLDAIPREAALWDVQVRGAARLAANLAAHRDEALLWRTLATLRTDVPLRERKRDLAWQGVPRAAWTAFCDRYGLGRLTDRPGRWAR